MQYKFLQQVADYYLGHYNDLSNYTFVFPNRRSAMFMKKYLHDAVESDPSRRGKPVFMPRMVSITYFIQQFNKSSLASPTELAFILYNSYCSLIEDPDMRPDFDRFYFWGSMILNDFNDVDSYMVDASELYKNLSDIRELKSNFLTEEQKEVVKYLWGEEYIPKDDEGFWQHMSDPDNDDTASAKFLYLWRAMGALYNKFIKTLDSLEVPLSYSGLQSRRACEQIKSMSLADFNGRKFAFIGFSVLSTSRACIFRRLRDLGIADFFWDIASPFINSDHPSDSGSRFILPLAQRFKMPDDFVLAPITSKPDIEIISVPSNFGQTKVASEILKEWSDAWHAEVASNNTSGTSLSAEKDALINTAVVLADENLLTPMLFSVPEEIESVNVTMGISYQSTPFSALMSAIISMHLRARQRGGTFYYFYQDVLDVLSHPHISLVVADDAESLKAKIISDHIYNISADEIIKAYPDLAFIFNQIVDDRDINQVRNYIDNLISTLRDKLGSRIKADDKNEYYEMRVLEGYSSAVEKLCDLIVLHKISLKEHTFLQMIERTLSMTPVTFSGKPLKGLQIMGINDTRNLDFDNLIILSMNERTFPRRNYNPSFIPMSLRRGYAMPTQEHEESSSAYQFYRLISRASKVRLLYDSRTAGLSSGEMSRYLAQLLHLNKDRGVKMRSAEFRAEADTPKEITVNKTPEVLEELKGFFPGGDLKLSASALKVYLSCPLKFYLQFVKRLRADDEVLEYIDASSYGSVIHKVVQELYADYTEKLVDTAVIDSMIASDLEGRTLSTLNKEYYNNRYERDLSRIPGEGQIIARIIARYVRCMLNEEKKIVPYTFVGAEVGERIKHEWRINDKYTLNFTMSIDRIDRLADGSLRFIDYKTGADKLSASDLDKIFEDSKLGGVFQLLLYSHAYASDTVVGFDGAIKPMIYKFQTMATDGITDLKYDDSFIRDYRDVSGFYEKFEEIIDRIFEPNNQYPFCQTQDLEHCKYCPFAQLCNRYPEDKY